MEFTDFSTDIYNALNVSAITSSVDVVFNPFTSTTETCLYKQASIPEYVMGVWKIINVYRTSAINNALEGGFGTYSASCRAQTEAESITIAAAVVNEINRKHYTGYFLKTSILPTIPPGDETDSYNTPVEIKIIKR